MVARSRRKEHLQRGMKESYGVKELSDTGGNHVLVQFSRSVVSNSLWPHRLQHTRPPCPSPTPRVNTNSCPLNWWCHPTISSSFILFSCLQSFPASGSFQMSHLFVSGDQSTGVSTSTSVLSMNTQDWCPLGWTPCSLRDSQESSPTPQFKNNHVYLTINNYQNS